jgi:hypothetical protein
LVVGFAKPQTVLKTAGPASATFQVGVDRDPRLVQALKTGPGSATTSPPGSGAHTPRPVITAVSAARGPYLVWFGADKNSIVDLRSGVGIDLPLPGGVEAAGDTIVVDRLSGPKGSVSQTDVSVLHPSQQSSLAPCAA